METETSGTLWTAVPRAQVSKGGEVENAHEGDKRGGKESALRIMMPSSTSEDSLNTTESLQGI